MTMSWTSTTKSSTVTVAVTSLNTRDASVAEIVKHVTLRFVLPAQRFCSMVHTLTYLYTV